jgi:two-component system, LytTR family, response regulator
VKQMLRALIVDDEELAVERIKMILNEIAEIEIGHTFLNPWEAYEYAKMNPIDIAFLDISMPEINGMRLSSLLLHLNPSIDVVFVTGYDNYAVQAFEMSALDYLLKPVTAQRMSKTLDKIRRRHRSEANEPSMEVFRRDPHKAVSSDSDDSSDKTLQPIANPHVETLTKREAEILYVLFEGLSNKEIAVRFGITEATVKSHVFRLYGKLRVKRRSQAIAKARELKLIE